MCAPLADLAPLAFWPCQERARTARRRTRERARGAADPDVDAGHTPGMVANRVIVRWVWRDECERGGWGATLLTSHVSLQKISSCPEAHQMLSF